MTNENHSAKTPHDSNESSPFASKRLRVQLPDVTLLNAKNFSLFRSHCRELKYASNKVVLDSHELDHLHSFEDATVQPTARALADAIQLARKTIFGLNEASESEDSKLAGQWHQPALAKLALVLRKCQLYRLSERWKSG